MFAVWKVCKSKGVPWQAEVALGVPGRPWIISMFGTTRVVGRQPYAPATFTPGEIPGTHFQTLSQPQGTWFCRKEPWKKSPVTSPGIDPGTVRLVAQRLNHYTTPGPCCSMGRVKTNVLTLRYKIWVWLQQSVVSLFPGHGFQPTTSCIQVSHVGASSGVGGGLEIVFKYDNLIEEFF